ncbi:hypothetical protein [Diaphorobacter caeni]|uniref:hypothetical protein n=1 Tax=Diaphorobacter caeni TaxID=2784387 RepID=UPI00188F14F2|nr:hypothetical protein [Diaphorobacter caeni]MBF5004444.1 hypothetical protein [Diaphorobacter caeni]
MSQFSRSVVKVLQNYSPTQPYSKESDEWKLLSEVGLVPQIKKMTHNEIVDWLIFERANVSKEAIVEAFLVGVGGGFPQMRCGISAYAYAMHFPSHAYIKKATDISNCSTCLVNVETKIDVTFLHRCRLSGSLVGSNPLGDKAAFYLATHREKVGYVEDVGGGIFDEGVRLFGLILKLIENSSDKTVPRTLVNDIRKIKELKLTAEQAKFFIDLLGYIGVLQPKGQCCYINEFFGDVEPRKTHSSDWAYPVDFWTGGDGVNMDAVNFWFGGQFDSVVG